MRKQNSHKLRNTVTGSAVSMNRPIAVLLIPLLLLFCYSPVALAASYTVNIDDGVFIEPGVAKFRVWLNTPIVAGDEGSGATFSTTDGSAIAGADFIGVPTANATFDNIGDFEKHIDITLSDDLLIEGQETFAVTLDGPINMGGGSVGPGDTVATGTINDDDALTVEFNQAADGADENLGTDLPSIAVTGDVVPGYTVAVDVTVDGASTATGGGTDFTDPATLMVPAGSYAGDKFGIPNLTIKDDSLFEADETFALYIDAAPGDVATGPQNSTVYTINNDDTYDVRIGSTAYAPKETDADYIIDIPVTLDQTVPGGATVTYTLTAGTAESSDYEDLSGGSLSFSAAETTQNIQIRIVGDDLLENDESFTLSLTAGSGQTVSNSPSTVTIVRDDYGVELVEAGTTPHVDEGNSVALTLRLQPSMGVAAGDTFTAYFQTYESGNTAPPYAQPGSDFTFFEDTVTWNPGDPVDKTGTVSTLDDSVVEDDEYFWALLGSEQGHTSSNHWDYGYVQIFIEDNDTATFTINDVAVNEDAGSMTFTVSLDAALDIPVDIDVSYADGSATGGGTDYDSATDTVSFPAGSTADQTVTVAISDDSLVEDDESFTANLAINAGTPVGDRSTDLSDTGIGSISSNNDTATFTINDVSVDESAGTVDFTVSLDTAIDIPVDIDVGYTDGTATGGGTDYDSATATATFPAGSAADQTVTVAISDDSIVEAAETFGAGLSVNAGTAIGGRSTDLTDTGTGTITSDNDTATFTIDDVSVNESAGTVDFTVSVSNAIDIPVDIDVSYTDGTAVGGGTDYDSAADTVSFPAGSTAGQTATVAINDDAIIEADESFTASLALNAGTPVGGRTTALTDTGVGEIVSDDTTTLAITDVSLPEGSGGGTTHFDFTVALPDAVQGGFDLAFTVEDGSATDADDYDGVTLSPLVFSGAAGEQQTIRVAVNADNVSEDDESFKVVLGALSNIQVTAADDITTGAEGIGTILYDDYEAFLGTVSTKDIDVDEGDLPAEDVNLTFTVSLDRPNKSGGSIDLQVSTTDDTAEAGSDYTALSGFAVAVADGEQSETFNVAVIEDEVVEHDEVVLVNLTSASGNTIVQASPNDRAVGTINNDDAATLAIDDVGAAEGANGDSTPLTFTVTLTGEVDQAFTVDWATSGGGATTDVDFESATGTLDFDGSDGQTQTLDVTVIGDDEVEFDETFFVILSNIVVDGKDVTFSDDTGDGIIQNDDKYRVTVDDVTADEPDGVATGPATFTILLNQAVLPGQTATVGYATGNSAETPNAAAGADYTAIAGTTLDFNGGESTKTVDVTILNDALDEDDTEYYYLNVSAVSANTALVDGTGLGAIVDNEYHVISSVHSVHNFGTIAPESDVIVERGSDSPAYMLTADTGYCIADVQRNGSSVLGGTVPPSPYTYTATNIQDDPTEIVASFRSEIHFTTHIEPVEAQEYGRWRLRDTVNNVYLQPGAPPTADPTAAWLESGETVIIPCNQSGFDLEYNEVGGWYTPTTVNYTIPPAAGTVYTATGTYISKTVKLTLIYSGSIGNEVIGVDPEGSGEGGEGTHTYLLTQNQAVTLTASASTTPGAESIFLGWSGASSETTNSVALVMDADKTITANFGAPGVDNDGDGYIAGDTAINPDWDCNDNDPTIHPNAIELCGDNIDQDCSGGDPVCAGPDKDDDGDGYTENQGDCDDTNAAIYPGAQEICGNDVDEDCYDGPRDCGTEVICSDYSERPLETQAQSAAPNVLFVLDDSGSMRWQTMTQEYNGLYDGNSTIYGNSTLERQWRSQFGGYNKIWYNPNQDYVPWPRWNAMADTEALNGTKIKNGGASPPLDADIDNPRSEPTDDGGEFNLNGDFFSVKPVAGAAAPITQWVTLRTDDNGEATAADAIRLRATDGSIEIIVDNSDGSEYYDDWGYGWNNSSTSNMYRGNARYNRYDDKYARWYFDMTADQATSTSGLQYYVDAWWPDWQYWTRYAKYKIRYNGGTDTGWITRNQRAVGGQWVRLGGPYSFVAQSTVSATSLFVKNAHYFIWVDHDGDETMLYEQNDGADFSNSEVYLVNLPGSGGTYEMNFYRFVDNDEDGRIDDDELLEVTDTDTYWNAIQPKSEGGTVRTPEQERQNFANWYSFYRRREFTAKAAIGRTIVGTSGMNIGILGINARIQEELVPIGVEGDRVKVVDNPDAALSGTWYTWNTSTAVAGSSRYADSNGATARFAPNFSAAEAGNYDVYAWWPCWTGWDSTTQYTVVDKNGSHPVTRDQRQGGSEGCGLWVPLGNYYFDDSGSQYVQVKSTGDYVAADAVRFVSTGSKVNVDMSDYILNKLYQVYSSGGTPLRRGLQNAGKYFDNEDSGASGGLNATAPWSSANDGGGCQRAFAILMTDGYYNGYDPSPSVGNEDSDGNRPEGTNKDSTTKSKWDKSIFAGPEGQTLADVAMYYYEKDLHEGLNDDVPSHYYDTADHQHMVTYGVSFGVTGTLDPAAFPKCLPDAAPAETAAVCPTWPKPDSDPERIDDLYHASVNGRGKYLSASSPGELVAALKEIIDDVADTSGTGSSVSINAQELKEGTLLFQASYITGSWRGDLKAKTLDPITGEVQNTLWSAAEELANKTPATRFIVTYDGTTGQQFRFDDTDKDLSVDQAKKLLNLDPATSIAADFSDLGAANTTELKKLVAYLRGDDTYEGTASGTYRQRPDKDGEMDIGPLGDIVHSAPQHVEDVVYVGGNDGMLHAFDDTTGEELFAYVPNLVYDDLDELASQNYSHNYYVDNSPYSLMIRDPGGNQLRLLVGTLGLGGKGIYALDISNVDSAFPATEADAKAIVKWEYPSNSQPTGALGSPGSDPDLGYGFGRAFIVNSELDDGGNATRHVVIMGNGYQSDSGRAMLYILDANDGELLGKIDTESGSPAVCNGLSVPVLIDPDFDGTVDFAYAGDLLGNMWKFDLRGDSISDWKVAYNTATDYSGTPMPLFQAINKEGWRQPITTKPDVIRHPDTGLGGYMVIFGTGRYLGNADFGDNSIQSIYGIWDWAKAWDNGEVAPDKYYGSFGPVAAGDPEFIRVNYAGKPSGSAFVVGQTVTGQTSGATGDIEEIVEDQVSLSYADKPAATDFAVGQTVTGGTSGATGIIETVTENDDASGYLILGNLSATAAFGAGESITSSTVTTDAVIGWVHTNTAGTLKLKNYSTANTFVMGELITSPTVTADAMVANDVTPVSFRPLTNLVGNAVGEYVTLLEQTQVAFLEGSRFLSDNAPYWFNPTGAGSGILEHVGWYFDLPGTNEKMIRDPLIRNGIVFAISSVPSSSPCASGGSSIIHAMDAASGGRSATAIFDISGPDGMPDGVIDEHDLVNIGSPDNPHYVAPTGLKRDAMWYTPAVLAVQNSDTDVMYFSTSEGDVKLEKVQAEKVGVYYWREVD